MAAAYSRLGQVCGSQTQGARSALAMRKRPRPCVGLWRHTPPALLSRAAWGQVDAILAGNGFMAELHARIVPVVVEREAFWLRYFYRCARTGGREGRGDAAPQRAALAALHALSRRLWCSKSSPPGSRTWSDACRSARAALGSSQAAQAAGPAGGRPAARTAAARAAAAGVAAAAAGVLRRGPPAAPHQRRRRRCCATG